MRWSVTISATGSPLYARLSEDLERFLAGARGDDREVPCVTAPQIALDGADDLLVVVDSEENRLPLSHGWRILVWRCLLGSRRSGRNAERSWRGC